MSRSRDYAFTFYPEEERELFTSNKVIRYIIYGIEKCPTTGRTHFQGYAYFAREVSWKIAKAELSNDKSLHVEECKGEREDNILYCMKGEQSKDEWKQFKEKGPNWGINAEIKEFGVKPKQGKRTDIHLFNQKLEEGVPLKDIIKDSNNYQCCRMAELKYKYCENKRPIKDIEVIWIYGGTARERKMAAYLEEEDIFTPMSDKWWDGYDMDKTVLIEEYDNKYCNSKRLDQLTDIFPFRIETKGGSRQVQYTKIIFTSKTYPIVPDEVLERLSLRNVCAEVEGNTSLDYDSASEEINKYIEQHDDDYDNYEPYVPFTEELTEEDTGGAIGRATALLHRRIGHQSKIGPIVEDVSASLRREPTGIYDA